MRIACALLLAACSKGKPAQPCERGGTVELRLVEADSAYMKQLFAHVGCEGRDCTASDPKALAAGVHAEIDQWRRELRDDEVPGMAPATRQTDYYLIAPDRDVLARYVADYPDKVPDDRALRFGPLTPTAWRSYYVHATPITDTRALASVTASDDSPTGKPLLWLSFTAAGKEAIRQATDAAGKRGDKIATLVDDVVMSAPIVNGAIPGGELSITLEDPKARDALVAKLGCRK